MQYRIKELKMELAADRNQARFIDKSLRGLVDNQYEFCLHKCLLVNTDLPNCKQDCYSRIIVPFKHQNHMARDEEENLYRKCLGSKLPNLKAEDYLTCSNQLYADRVQILSTYLGNLAESVLHEIH